MSVERVDVAVVGAGPAGLGAAIEAARCGLEVVVLDEGQRPGGQIYRSPARELRPRPETASLFASRAGRKLLAEARSGPIQIRQGVTVWGSFEPGRLEFVDADGAASLKADAIVLATGTHDRPVPFPGWTLPGVMGVGGAQAVLKGQAVLPGRRILLAGSGPLLLVVASQLARAGATVVAVAEAVSARRLLRRPLSLLAGRGLLLDAALYRLSLLLRRVPWLAPAVITRVEGEGRAQVAWIADAGVDWSPRSGSERRFEVDAVCVGYGLVPSVELARLLGCAMRLDSASAAYVPIRDGRFQTSVPGVYAVGDGAGVAGALVAVEEGRVAGLAIAEGAGRLGRSEAGKRLAGPRARLRRLERFREVLDAAYAPGRGLLQLATPDTLLCRCEEVTAAEVDRAVAEGARRLDQVKAWTRAGMGSCQGRMCGLPTAARVAVSLGAGIERVGAAGVRPPIRPVPLGALARSADGG